MKPLVLDIETIPLRESLRAAYPEAERTPPANYKSEETIAKWREGDRKKWAEDRAKQCSVNPRLGRVLCVGTSAGIAYAETDEQEAQVLRQTWDWIKQHHGLVVTWNGEWDLRFILIRSMANGVKPTIPAHAVQQWFKRYSSYPHFDCKSVLTNWDNRVSGEGLSEWTKFFGLAGKTEGLSGADVWPLFQGGMHDEIKEYCLQDVAATASVYEHIAPYFN